MTAGWLIARPGSLLEVRFSGRLWLHGGEVIVTASKSDEAAFQTLDPHDQQIAIAPDEPAYYEIGRERKLTSVTKKPVWLAGVFVTPFDGFPLRECRLIPLSPS